MNRITVISRIETAAGDDLAMDFTLSNQMAIHCSPDMVQGTKGDINISDEDEIYFTFDDGQQWEEICVRYEDIITVSINSKCI